ncbi:hypothetical protein H8D04_01340 [bacterium]|nr:hypothetical protein [bacterium]
MEKVQTKLDKLIHRVTGYNCPYASKDKEDEYKKDILWIERIIRDYPVHKIGRYGMIYCNRLWKKYE